jgi:hypothetical protein
MISTCNFPSRCWMCGRGDGEAFDRVGIPCRGTPLYGEIPSPVIVSCSVHLNRAGGIALTPSTYPAHSCVKRSDSEMSSFAPQTPWGAVQVSPCVSQPAFSLPAASRHFILRRVSHLPPLKCYIQIADDFRPCRFLRCLDVRKG